MGSRPESRKELRIEGCCRGWSVSGKGLAAKAETAFRELKVQADQPLIIVTRDPRRQELLSKLDRCSDCPTFFPEDLLDSRHVVYLAIAVVEKTIAVECTYEILQILKRT